jgi:hypothetical protein
MRDHILPYLDESDKEIRQAAALACCKVLERHAALAAEVRRSQGQLAVGSVRHGKVGGQGLGSLCYPVVDVRCCVCSVPSCG